ncbi:Peptidase [Aphelenchoides besseyi]|nr:Peptidase [Aphelenchoides besseyi]
MTDAMREMIEQLMGGQRAEEEGRKLPSYDHHSVCRAYLLDCCPREILMDTRLEGLVSCRKMHEKALRADFLREQEKRDHIYEVEAFDALEEAVKAVDYEIEKVREKVKKDSENLSDSHDFMKSKKISELNEKITVILAEMEALGSEGKVNESIELSKTVGELQKRKGELENDIKGAQPVQQRLRVCEACGAQLNVLDNESRLADHYGGKMHLGMVIIREKYEEMKIGIEDKRAARRESDRRTHDKDKDYRRRDRSRSHERDSKRRYSSRRDRSRSRDYESSRRDRRSSPKRRRSRSRERCLAMLLRRRNVAVRDDDSQLLETETVVTELKPARELLFRHWLFIILGVALIYGLVVMQDRRMPAVVPATENRVFSEERARSFLNKLTALGPRSSGSVALELDAFKLVTDEIARINGEFNRTGVNRLELDVQRPTGCFNLKFLTPFTLCYHQITNILVRVGPKTPSPHAVLLNCHLDTLPDTPGATDDASLAEENFLQGSHGFITQHRWRHDVRAFINLEGTGSGGREILFQADKPGDSWILETYLDHAPHPHCSVIAQEVFQLGIVPSDTDFRILRDFGLLSGLDIAYHRNGWSYHTEFDTADVISVGSIQRGGENVLAVAQALVRSPSLSKPAQRNDGNKWVFYDVVGLFTVRYKAVYGAIANYLTIFLVGLIVYAHLMKNAYTLYDLFVAFYHHFLAFVAMAITGIIVAIAVHLLGLTMCWYSLPELVFPLYIVPMLIAGSYVHSHFALKQRGKKVIANPYYKSLLVEMVHYDAVLVYWSLILFLLTANGYASAFYILFHVLFPALRDPILHVYHTIRKSFDLGHIITPWNVFVVQWLCLLPVIMYICYAVNLFFDFFTPVMGRFGNMISPELFMMPISLITASTFVLFTSNLIYLSRPMNYFFKVAIAFFALCFLLIATTRIGNPYKWSDDGLPRLRRIIALHSKRTIYDFHGNVNSSSTGLFIQSFDFRGVDDLPEHTFLQASNKPDCSKTADAYCQLPYYTAIYDLLPPEQSRWVPLPSAPTFPHPLSVQLLDRQSSDNGRTLNMSLVIRGGVDKLSLHITPLNGYRMTQFSFTTLDRTTLGERSTYFVFMTYGHKPPEERRFWVVLERETAKPTRIDEGVPNLELVVATHQAHGRYQNSPTLHQLRSLINTRRKTPHVAVGYWKWGITMIGGTSELISHLF